MFEWLCIVLDCCCVAVGRRSLGFGGSHSRLKRCTCGDPWKVGDWQAASQTQAILAHLERSTSLSKVTAALRPIKISIGVV